MSATASPTPPAPSPQAIVRAAITALSRTSSFRTVTTSPSLDEVAVVEPRLRREAATAHLTGPAGHGVLHVAVSGGAEYLEADAPGWADLLEVVHAPAATIDKAGSFAAAWYEEPRAQSSLVDGFGPSLRGVGHVFCTGAGCTLSGARVVARPRGEVVVDVPAFGGDLVLDTAAHLRPVALLGSGARGGLEMRFAYPASVASIRPPADASPAPAAITG